MIRILMYSNSPNVLLSLFWNVLVLKTFRGGKILQKVIRAWELQLVPQDQWTNEWFNPSSNRKINISQIFSSL
jgi:hypothetical protein